MIGNEPDALELYGPGEILSGHEFYDYAAKYTPGLSETTTSAEVTPIAAGGHAQARPRRLPRRAAARASRGSTSCSPASSSSCPRSTRSRASRRSACSRRCAAAGGYDFAAVCRRVVDLALERAAGRVRHRLTAATCPADDDRRPIAAGPGLAPGRPSALRPGARPGGGVRRTPHRPPRARPASRRSGPGALLALLVGARGDLRRDLVGRVHRSGGRRSPARPGRPRSASSRRSRSPTARTCSRSGRASSSGASRRSRRSAGRRSASPCPTRSGSRSRSAGRCWRGRSAASVPGGRRRACCSRELDARRRPEAPPSCPWWTTRASAVDGARRGLDAGPGRPSTPPSGSARCGPADVGSGRHASSTSALDDQNGFVMRADPVGWRRSSASTRRRSGPPT